MRALADYRCALFDCDGVVLQSNGLKTEAFRDALYGEDPGLIDAFIDYHRCHGGISRYVKFRHFYQDMKQEKEHEHMAAAAVTRYARIAREGLASIGLVPGVMDMLEWFRTRMISCFIVSGGDQAELREVFHERGLDRYFAEILGSPTPKPELVMSLQETRRISMPAIYFGDARSYMETAMRYDLDFCLIHGYSEWEQGVDCVRDRGLPGFRDFDEFIAARLPKE